MCKNFFKWIMYNPNNVSLVDVAPEMVIFLLLLFICIYLYLSVFTKKTMLRRICLSVLFLPYAVFIIAWSLYCMCMDATFLVRILPIYPIMLIYVMKKIIKYKKQE